MSTSGSNDGSQWEPSGFDSLDTEFVIIDGPEDTTIRRTPPHLLPFLLAERERVLRWQKLLEESQSLDRPPDVLNAEFPEQEPFEE